METNRTIDLFPFASSPSASGFGMPAKASVILIRWPVVIICSYLLLYPVQQDLPESLLHPFILLYIGSNVGLYFVNEKQFASARFYSPLVLADTLVLTLSLVVNGQIEADFYLAYFLLIIICCIFENPRILALISFLAPIVYGLLLFRSTGNPNPSVYLRLPFLFIIALFYGYFTQLVRAQKRLKQEAEQRIQGKKEMLDIVSHEFRTPLTLITGYAQAVKARVFGAVTNEQEEALGKILRQSDNLLYMVNAMLDLARIDGGEVSAERGGFSVGELLRELRVDHESPLDKPVTLQWLIPDDLPTMCTDKAKLRIILQNLINNAIKFTDEGIIQVSARQTADRKRIEFEVADSGIGISKETVPFVFDKFRQADSSSTRQRGGVGLGLHIVRVFTESLGGTVSVKSQLGKGSTFTLVLPVEAVGNTHR
ncbi:MAG: sensor histidine kinase [Alphaproteobacteria bacterium]